MSKDDLIFAMKEIDDCPVRGHLKMIDDTRLVFVGENPDRPDAVCLGFRNSEGEDTKIILTKEAYEALKWLITEPFKGKRQSFPYKLQWKLEVTEKPSKEEDK
jgi:hypothetical protein